MNPLLEIPANIRKLITQPVDPIPPHVDEEIRRPSPEVYLKLLEHIADPPMSALLNEAEAPESDQVRATRTARELFNMPETDHLAFRVSDAQADLIVEAIDEGLHGPSALRCAGIEPRAYAQSLRLAKKHRDAGGALAHHQTLLLDLEECIKTHEGGTERKVLNVVLDSALTRGNVAAAQWWLERRHPERWGKNSTIAHQGSVKVAGKVEHVKVVRLADLSLEQVRIMQQALITKAIDV